MRALFLLVLSAGLMVGCTNSRYDRYDRTGRAYPASARVDSRGGQARYVVCHKGKQTKTLPESAVRGHLNHGDRFGSCRRRGDDRRAGRRADDRRDDRRARGKRGKRGKGRN